MCARAGRPKPRQTHAHTCTHPSRARPAQCPRPTCTPPPGPPASPFCKTTNNNNRRPASSELHGLAAPRVRPRAPAPGPAGHPVPAAADLPELLLRARRLQPLRRLCGGRLQGALRAHLERECAMYWTRRTACSAACGAARRVHACIKEHAPAWLMSHVCIFGTQSFAPADLHAWRVCV